MPNYQEGKIYKVFTSINNDLYIGNTTQTLSYIMKEHRADCKIRPHLPLYKAMVEYAKAYFYIELLEKHPCNDKLELDRKEGEYIRSLNPVMNQMIPGRGPKERYVDNKERFKQYYQDNEENIKEQMKENYQDNKEKIKERMREHAKRTKEMVTCECGCELTKRGLKQHIATKKHQNPMV